MRPSNGTAVPFNQAVLKEAFKNLPRSINIREFCKNHGISHQTLYLVLNKDDPGVSEHMIRKVAQILGVDPDIALPTLSNNS